MPRAPVGIVDEPDLRAWEWLAETQLNRLWNVCVSGASKPPFAAVPSDLDAAACGAGVTHYAAAFQRGGDLVAGPRPRYFHRAGAAARVRVTLPDHSDWTGAFRPGSRLAGLLRLSVVLGAKDTDWQAADGPLPAIGAALKVPVWGAPSLNAHFLQAFDEDCGTLDAALKRAMDTALPSVSNWNLSGARRFGAEENNRRSAAALRALDAPPEQTTTRLSVERWCTLHPSGERCVAEKVPWAIRFRFAPAVEAALTEGPDDFRERLVSLEDPTAFAPFATLQTLTPHGDVAPLAEIRLESEFVVSPTITERLHFQHPMGGR